MILSRGWCDHGVRAVLVAGSQALLLGEVVGVPVDPGCGLDQQAIRVGSGLGDGQLRGGLLPPMVICPRSSHWSPSRTRPLDVKVICGCSWTCRKLVDLTSLPQAALPVWKLAASSTPEAVEEVTGSVMVISPEISRKLPCTLPKPNRYRVAKVINEAAG
jgi:hypothetical protein